ncbi:translational machinery component [Aaosphaeria arxii CBS 175.79]|uniref:Small ribosomal subunit protein uS11m n=1 Tax=Aaosphaeria arxii CBS 175.79 TaxID=1450172 RepID=A0A6A5Y0A9_9PLEO|nr:translational machinery component [Aaosphaeria arxii CBS 175.79]KAF2018968.1 translational machinery component [Aaosphaeria arxii CBS 175.79]
MGKYTAMRLFNSLQSSICASCRSGLPLPSLSLSSVRSFSNSSRMLARTPPPQEPQDPLNMDSLLKNVDNNFRRVGDSFHGIIPGQGTLDGFQNLAKQEWEEDDRHHLHIYAHKHNTHITLTKPNRDALISVSCGNIGFRKSGRGSYDAAYQLAAFVMSRIQDKGLLPQIKKLELVYRGFGPGREAVTKAILGSEGRKIRPLVCRLSDSTRLKFGGTRSKKPRRLG